MIQHKRLPWGVAAIAACVWSSSARGDDVDADAQDVSVRVPRRAPMRAPKDPTVAGSVLTRDELDAPGERVADALRGQVGIQVAQAGPPGSPATASIRGATPAQVPVYLAGVRLNDDVAGAADLSRVPLWLIDRVEIYRGNAPLDADRLGMGGAVFFEPRWPKTTGGGAGGTLGSFGERASWAYASLGDRDAAVLAGVSAEGASNDYTYDNDHGTLLAPTGVSTSTLPNADFRIYDAWVLGRARLGGGATLDAFVNAMSRQEGAVTLATVPARSSRESFDRGVAAARAQMPLGSAASLEADSSFSLAHTTLSDPLNELALASKSVQLAGTRATERLAVRAAPTASLSLHGAADVATSTLARDDDGNPRLRARRFESRVALGARQWIGDSFSIQPLGALECDGTTVGVASFCDTFVPSGRAGVAWTRPTWEVYANAGRYERVPTLGELYGVAVLVHGNAMLRPESGVTIDAGVRVTTREPKGGTKPAWAVVGGYVRWADDLISYVRSAQGFSEPFNVDRARVAGLEVQAGAGLLPWLSTDVSATLLDPRDVTPDRRLSNDVLPFQSRFVVAPRVAVETSLGLAPVDRVHAEARWVYQSSRYADAAGLIVIPDQSSLDAELSARSRDGRWALRVRAADILDTLRVDIVGFPLPRRAFYAALEETW